jgi:hypothetical protein
VEFDVEAFLNRKFKGKIAYVSPPSIRRRGPSPSKRWSTTPTGS